MGEISDPMRRFGALRAREESVTAGDKSGGRGAVIVCGEWRSLSRSQAPTQPHQARCPFRLFDIQLAAAKVALKLSSFIREGPTENIRRGGAQ